MKTWTHLKTAQTTSHCKYNFVKLYHSLQDHCYSFHYHLLCNLMLTRPLFLCICNTSINCFVILLFQDLLHYHCILLIKLSLFVPHCNLNYTIKQYIYKKHVTKYFFHQGHYTFQSYSLEMFKRISNLFSITKLLENLKKYLGLAEIVAVSHVVLWIA